MGRGSPPQGRLRDHDHSRAGEGGVTLTDPEITAAILSLAAAGSTDIPITDFAVGSLDDGDFLKREGASLGGATVSGGVWNHDQDLSLSGSASYEITPNTTYDMYNLIIEKMRNVGSAAAWAGIRVNGNTTVNYWYTFPSANRNTQNEVRFVHGNDLSVNHHLAGAVLFNGRWDNGWAVDIQLGASHSGVRTNLAFYGGAPGLTSPLDKFSLRGGDTYEIEAVLYGRDVP